MLSNFWENERPSSSDDESETENHSSEQTVENIETVKDLDLSKNELKSVIRKLEYKIKSYQNKFKSQRRTIRRLKKENEVMKNQNQHQALQIQNELKSFKEQFDIIKNCESFV